MYAFGSAAADRSFGVELAAVLLAALVGAWAYGRIGGWIKARKRARRR